METDDVCRNSSLSLNRNLPIKRKFDDLTSERELKIVDIKNNNMSVENLLVKPPEIIVTNGHANIRLNSDIVDSCSASRLLTTSILHRHGSRGPGGKTFF